jgi:hypothetical protein
MDSLAAATCITKAGTLRVASIEYGNLIREQIDACSRRIAAGRGSVGLAKAIARMRKHLTPIVESLLDSAEGLVREVRLALRLQDTSQFDRRWWQLALISLQSERELLETACGRVRSEARRLARTSKIGAGLWLPDWERRYVELLERIDDVSETIALGLNPDTRAELEQLSKATPLDTASR